jgi:hypothetical protein
VPQGGVLCIALHEVEVGAQQNFTAGRRGQQLLALLAHHLAQVDLEVVDVGAARELAAARGKSRRHFNDARVPGAAEQAVDGNVAVQQHLVQLVAVRIEHAVEVVVETHGAEDAVGAGGGGEAGGRQAGPMPGRRREQRGIGDLLPVAVHAHLPRNSSIRASISAGASSVT